MLMVILTFYYLIFLFKWYYIENNNYQIKIIILFPGKKSRALLHAEGPAIGPPKEYNQLKLGTMSGRVCSIAEYAFVTKVVLIYIT